MIVRGSVAFVRDVAMRDQHIDISFIRSSKAPIDRIFIFL